MHRTNIYVTKGFFVKSIWRAFYKFFRYSGGSNSHYHGPHYGGIGSSVSSPGTQSPAVFSAGRNYFLHSTKSNRTNIEWSIHEFSPVNTDSNSPYTYTFSLTIHPRFFNPWVSLSICIWWIDYILVVTRLKRAYAFSYKNIVDCILCECMLTQITRVLG